MMKMIEVTENYSVKFLLEKSNKLDLLREILRFAIPVVCLNYKVR